MHEIHQNLQEFITKLLTFDFQIAFCKPDKRSYQSPECSGSADWVSSPGIADVPRTKAPWEAALCDDLSGTDAVPPAGIFGSGIPECCPEGSPKQIRGLFCEHVLGGIWGPVLYRLRLFSGKVWHLEGSGEHFEGLILISLASHIPKEKQKLLFLLPVHPQHQNVFW